MRWMRGRSLGNSSTSAYRNLCVRHREHWIAQTTHYLSVVGKFPDYATDPSRLTTQLPQMVSVPFPAWLLSVYANDVLTRLPEQKAGVTSIYGTILKMDSTKKGKKTHARNITICRDRCRLCLINLDTFEKSVFISKCFQTFSRSCFYKLKCWKMLKT